MREFCVLSLFCCAIISVISSFAIILMGKRDLVALLRLTDAHCTTTILQINVLKTDHVGFFKEWIEDFLFPITK